MLKNPLSVRRQLINGRNHASLANYLKPTLSKRTVGLWLLGCAGMVYGAVAVGGLTRFIILA